MGKGIIKYGYKSGILPKARQIFKQPIKPVAADPAVKQGFAEGIKHPKGSRRDPLVPQPVPVSARIDRILPTQSKLLSESDLAKLPETQQFKLKRKSLRRDFLISSLKAEELRLEKAEIDAENKRLQKIEDAKRIAALESETEAERLTLPTIEERLKKPIMKHRTPEETEIVRLKRKSNRLATELKLEEAKAQQLLDLYYDADDFIVDEQELEAAVDRAFDDSDAYFQNAIHNVRSKLMGVNSVNTQKMDSLNSGLSGVIFGSANADKPGLQEIEDTLTGNFSKLEQEAKLKEQEKLLEENNKFVRDLLEVGGKDVNSA